MKTLKILLLGMIYIPLMMNAQEEEDSGYSMVEITLMKPAKGMAKKMEDAIKKHNEKYHPSGPYGSFVWEKITGNESGWYVWGMGPLTFSDLDGAPGPGEHMEDWHKNVEPYIAEYGPTEYWKLNEEMSNSDGDQEDWQVVWRMGIEWSQFYRFKEFMTKVSEVQKESGEEMNVWMNQFSQDNGDDVAFTWPFDKWSDLDDDDFNMMKAFDEKYGPMSWANAMKEWESFNTSMQQEVWRRVK